MIKVLRLLFLILCLKGVVFATPFLIENLDLLEKMVTSY